VHFNLLKDSGLVQHCVFEADGPSVTLVFDIITRGTNHELHLSRGVLHHRVRRLRVCHRNLITEQGLGYKNYIFTVKSDLI